LISLRKKHGMADTAHVDGRQHCTVRQFFGVGCTRKGINTQNVDVFAVESTAGTTRSERPQTMWKWKLMGLEQWKNTRPKSPLSATHLSTLGRTRDTRSLQFEQENLCGVRVSLGITRFGNGSTEQHCWEKTLPVFSGTGFVVCHLAPHFNVTVGGSPR
jgi:hypothetical protein